MGLLDVAKVDWDYFSPENAQKARIQTLISNAEKAKKLRDQILKTHGQFDEIKQATEKLVAKSTLSTEEDMKKAALKKMESHNALVEGKEHLDGLNVEDRNGSMVVIHPVASDDSLFSISLMYNVNQRQIMFSNGLMSDFIGMKTTLNIPMTESFKYTPPAGGNRKKTADEAIREEKNIREVSVSLMN